MTGEGPTDFMRRYEEATNRHDSEALVPLIAKDAVYWFSDGSYAGRPAVLAGIAETFDRIRDEEYRIHDLTWLVADDACAVCRYLFSWTGTVDGQPRSGRGRGTNVVIYREGRWQMLHEHLSA